MRRALVFSYYFPPMNGPVTQHPTWFFRYLPLYGLESHVISSSVFFGESLGAPSLSGNVHSVPAGRLAQRCAYGLCRLEFHIQARLRIWEHGFAWARAYGIGEACRLIQAGGFDAVISVSPSMASHWGAYRIKRRFPALTWIADFTDPFLGNPLRNSAKWLVPHERRFEQSLFATADYLGANTAPARDLWRERYPQHASKCVVIPNGYDPEEAIAALPLPPRSAPVLAHAGGVYGGRIPNALFESLYELAQAGQIRPGQLHVEFLGLGDFSAVRRPEQFEFLCKSGFVTVRNDYVPRQQALRYTEEADFLLVLDITAPHNTKLQLPSKVFDYLRIGRPILTFTADGSPTARLIEQSGIQHVIIPNDAPPREVQDGILRFLSLPRGPRQCSDWVIRNFDARNIAGRVAALIQGDQPPDIPQW